MNKKFTFMVAALLAAGSLSANAEVTAITENVKTFSELVSGQYYYIGIDKINGTADNVFKTDDSYLGMSVDETTGIFTYTAQVASEAPTTDEFLWKITKKDGAIILENKANGYALAFNGESLVATVQEYNTLGNDKVKKLTYTATGNTLKFAESKFLSLTNDAAGNVTIDASGTDIYYQAVPQTPVIVESMENYGKGFDLAFEGNVSGDEIFEDLTVVEIELPGSGSGEAETAIGGATEYFMLAKGEIKKTLTYGSDDFKKTEFVVLSTESVIDGLTAPNGYKYTKVKGEKLVDDCQSDKIEAGKYPLMNALFQAFTDINNEGKIKLYQPAVLSKDDENWSTTASDVWVAATGNTGSLLVNAQEENSAWLTVGKGTAVSVKDLVKGKKLVYVMTTAGESSNNFDYLLFDNLESSNYVVFTENADASIAQKNYLTSQWFVSANADNTVTLINRETGAAIEDITLFSTVASGVYTAKTATTTKVNGKYLKFIDVEDATAYDGYVNLSDEDLKETYKLNTSAAVEDFAVDVVLEQALDGNGKGSTGINLKSSSEKEIVWKFAQATKTVEDEEGEEVSVVDTIYQISKYNYYDAGKLKAAADTLKVFKYNLSATNSVKVDDNVNYNALGTGFAFVDGVVTADEDPVAFQSVILRKKGDKFVMAYAPSKDEPAESLRDQLIEAEYAVNSNAKLGVGAADKALAFSIDAVSAAPQYAVPESHFALEIGGAYLGANANETGILTNDTTMLKSTDVDSSFSFWAFSADKEEAKTPSYYLSTNGKLMYNPSDSIKAINDEIATLSTVFEADKIAALYEEKAQYVNGDPKETDEALVKFQQAKYVNADSLYVVEKGINGDALKPFKFNVLDVDGSAVLKANDGKYVAVVNGVAVLRGEADAAKFTVVAAEAPTSNESVSASEVAVVAQNGSVVVKNAAGKNVVVSTILGQVVANEVLTSDNATINVPAGIVVVAVEGESFKVNVK